ncbi:hypothetical protein AB1Y20_000663 [Prymnesium parvum]|uniref:Uncharacterized protein n=1 Tax=Prymnesium parvum TaxID=97485 RepID=A0AB34K966_PRYPA
MSSIVEAASNLMSPSAPPPSSPSLPVLPPSALLSSLSPLPPTQKAPAYPHRPRSYAVVNEINARWQHGTPSNNLSSAGVMLHLFDDYEDKANGRPWRMCRREQCPSQIEIDHLSCSVVNAQRPAIFPGGAAEGIILSADAQFLCAYSKDVGSGAASYRGGCNGKQTRQGYYKLPHTLQGAMEEQSAMAYNEVIVGRTCIVTSIVPGVLTLGAHKGALADSVRLLESGEPATLSVSAPPSAETGPVFTVKTGQETILEAATDCRSFSPLNAHLGLRPPGDPDGHSCPRAFRAYIAQQNNMIALCATIATIMCSTGRGFTWENPPRLDAPPPPHEALGLVGSRTLHRSILYEVDSGARHSRSAAVV